MPLVRSPESGGGSQWVKREVLTIDRGGNARANTSLSDSSLVSSTSKLLHGGCIQTIYGCRTIWPGHPKQGINFPMNILFKTLTKTPVINNSKCNLGRPILNGTPTSNLKSGKSAAEQNNTAFIPEKLRNDWKTKSCPNISKRAREDSSLKQPKIKHGPPNQNQINISSGRFVKEHENERACSAIGNFEIGCVSNCKKPYDSSESHHPGIDCDPDERTHGSSEDDTHTKDRSLSLLADNCAASLSSRNGTFSILSASNNVSCNHWYLKSHISCCPHCKLSSTLTARPLVHITGVYTNPCIDPATVNMLQNHAKTNLQAKRPPRSPLSTKKQRYPQLQNIYPSDKSQNSSSKTSREMPTDDLSSPELLEEHNNVDDKEWILSQVEKSLSPICPSSRPSAKVQCSVSNVEISLDKKLLEEEFSPHLSPKRRVYNEDLVEILFKVLSSSKAKESNSGAEQNPTIVTGQNDFSQVTQDDEGKCPGNERSKTYPPNLQSQWGSDYCGMRPLLQVKYNAPVTWFSTDSMTSNQRTSKENQTKNRKARSSAHNAIIHFPGKDLLEHSLCKTAHRQLDRKMRACSSERRRRDRIDANMKLDMEVDSPGGFSVKKSTTLFEKRAKTLRNVSNSCVKSKIRHVRCSPFNAKQYPDRSVAEEHEDLQDKKKPCTALTHKTGSVLSHNVGNSRKKVTPTCCGKELPNSVEKLGKGQRDKTVSSSVIRIRGKNGAKVVGTNEARPLTAKYVPKRFNGKEKLETSSIMYEDDTSRKADHGMENPSSDKSKLPGGKQQLSFKAPNQIAGAGLSATSPLQEQLIFVPDSSGNGHLTITDTFVSKQAQPSTQSGSKRVAEIVKDAGQTLNNPNVSIRVQENLITTSKSVIIGDNNTFQILHDMEIAPLTHNKKLHGQELNNQDSSSLCEKNLEGLFSMSTFPKNNRRVELNTRQQEDERYDESSTKGGETLDVTTLGARIQARGTTFTMGGKIKRLEPEMCTVMQHKQANLGKTDKHVCQLPPHTTGPKNLSQKHTKENQKPTTNICRKDLEESRNKTLMDEVIFKETGAQDKGGHLHYGACHFQNSSPEQIAMEHLQKRSTVQSANLPLNLVFNFHSKSSGDQEYPLPPENLLPIFNTKCSEILKVNSVCSIEDNLSTPEFSEQLYPRSSTPLSEIYYDETADDKLGMSGRSCSPESMSSSLESRSSVTVIRKSMQETKQQLLTKRKHRQFRSKSPTSRTKNPHRTHLLKSSYKVDTDRHAIKVCENTKDVAFDICPAAESHDNCTLEISPQAYAVNTPIAAMLPKTDGSLLSTKSLSSPKEITVRRNGPANPQAPVDLEFLSDGNQFKNAKKDTFHELREKCLLPENNELDTIVHHYYKSNSSEPKNAGQITADSHQQSREKLFVTGSVGSIRDNDAKNSVTKNKVHQNLTSTKQLTSSKCSPKSTNSNTVNSSFSENNKATNLMKKNEENTNCFQTEYMTDYDNLYEKTHMMVVDPNRCDGKSSSNLSRLIDESHLTRFLSECLERENCVKIAKELGCQYTDVSYNMYQMDARGKWHYPTQGTQHYIGGIVQETPLDLSQKARKFSEVASARSCSRDPVNLLTRPPDIGSHYCTFSHITEQHSPLNLSKSDFQDATNINLTAFMKDQQVRTISSLLQVSSGIGSSKENVEGGNAEIIAAQLKGHNIQMKQCSCRMLEKEKTGKATFHGIKDWARSTFLSPTDASCSNYNACDAVPITSETLCRPLARGH